MGVPLMNPRLFEFSTTLSYYFQSVRIGNSTYSFPKFGKGEFTKITKPVEVKRNLQNDYTFYMEISQDDELASIVQPDMAIVSTVKPETSYTQSSFQIFVIKNVKFENKRVQISADHVKYMFFNNVIVGDPTGEPYIVKGQMQSVLNTVLDSTNVFLPNIFTVNATLGEISVDIGTNATRTVGDLFDNYETGILKQNDGYEIDFDNFTIYVVQRIGNNLIKNILRYGDNISESSMEISNEKEYTHVIPYASVATTNKTVTIGGDTVEQYTGEVTSITLYGEDSPLDTLATGNFIKILTIDFSSKFTRKSGYVNPNPTSGYSSGYDYVKAKLKEYGQKYIAKHPKIKQPLINISVSNKNEIKDLNGLRIGDSVRVIYEPLNYEETHRVTEVNYNPIANSYNSITIGDRKYSLYDFIRKMR